MCEPTSASQIDMEHESYANFWFLVKHNETENSATISKNEG